jgi:hypothetical protein
MSDLEYLHCEVDHVQAARNGLVVKRNAQSVASSVLICLS